VKGLFDSKERALAGERDKAIERARAAEASLREALDKAEAERKALTKRVNELRSECEVRATVIGSLVIGTGCLSSLIEGWRHCQLVKRSYKRAKVFAVVDFREDTGLYLSEEVKNQGG
jgi:hypothetical protein